MTVPNPKLHPKMQDNEGNLALTRVGHGTRAVAKVHSLLLPWRVVIAERHGKDKTSLRWQVEVRPGERRLAAEIEQFTAPNFQILEWVEHVPPFADNDPRSRAPRLSLVYDTAPNPDGRYTQWFELPDGTSVVPGTWDKLVRGENRHLRVSTGEIAALLYGAPRDRDTEQWRDLLVEIGVPVEDASWMASGVFQKVRS